MAAAVVAVAGLRPGAGRGRRRRGLGGRGIGESRSSHGSSRSSRPMRGRGGCVQQRARFGISFGISRCVWDQNEHGQRGGSSVAAVNGSSSVVAASSSAMQRPWRGVASAAVWSRVARPQQASASLGHCVRVALAVRCGQSVGRACVWACGSARAGLSAVAVRPAATVCNCRNITMFYLPAEFFAVSCPTVGELSYRKRNV